MDETCTELGPLRDAFADGQIGEEDAVRLRRHLEGCAACRRDVKDRAVLRRAIGRITLPPAPEELRTRISTALDLTERRHAAARFFRWSTVAAAGLAAALLLLIVTPAGADVPPIVRHSSDFHDRLLSGAVQPASASSAEMLRDYFRKATGADVAVPAPNCECCGIDGGYVCDMPMDGKKCAAPCILYRHRSTLVSLMMVPDDGLRLPAHARRRRGDGEYYAFRRGPNTVLVCPSGGTCRVWVARMNENELVETAMSADRQPAGVRP